MLNHSYDRSFIASIECVTPGLEGYLDCAKLAERGGHAARAADDWMIVTSLTLREPHLFWFRCLFDESTGLPYYDIQSWSRRTGRDFQSDNRHLDFNHNGYPALYSQTPEVGRLWEFVILQEDGYQASMTSIVEAGQHIDGQIWNRSNLALRAKEPEQVADHWFAYANTNNGQVLDLRLNVLHIGEELMDDQ